MARKTAVAKVGHVALSEAPTPSRPHATRGNGTLPPRRTGSGEQQEPRRRAVADLSVIKVLEESVTAGTPGPHACRRSHPQTWLRVRAWVAQGGYPKAVWAELCLLDHQGSPLHRENSLRLQYQEPAGGGGAFFTLHTPVALPVAAPRGDPWKFQYRIFCQLGDTVFTDGIFHEHQLA